MLGLAILIREIYRLQIYGSKHTATNMPYTVLISKLAKASMPNKPAKYKKQSYIYRENRSERVLV
jgi:hypothetical protein